MTAEAAGAVPDDVIEEGKGWMVTPSGVLYDGARHAGHILLDSVPSVAEVFARDAKVREIVAAPEPDDLTKWVPAALSRYEFIAALYSEDGTR